MEYRNEEVASQILLPYDKVLELICNYGYDAERIARLLNSDINLVALEIASLNQQGYNFRNI